MKDVRRKLSWLISQITWPVSYFVSKNTGRTRLLIKANGLYLVVRPWYHTSHWALPGGGIRKSELKKSAVIREAKEELGLQLHSAQLQYLGMQPCRSRGIRYFGYFYLANLLRQPDLKLNIELLDARWISKEEFSETSFDMEVGQALSMVRSS